MADTCKECNGGKLGKGFAHTIDCSEHRGTKKAADFALDAEDLESARALSKEHSKGLLTVAALYADRPKRTTKTITEDDAKKLAKEYKIPFAAFSSVATKLGVKIKT